MRSELNRPVRLSNENIERVVRFFFLFFLIIVFITTVVGSFSGFIEHNDWKIGDWLINYQGGMVRRGLLGEVIYQLSYFTHIDPGIFVFLFQISSYAIYFIFSYLLLKIQDSLLPYAFLIFSPFIFTFQINNFYGGYRKEVLYFAVLAFIVYSAKVCKKKSLKKYFI